MSPLNFRSLKKDTGKSALGLAGAISLPLIYVLVITCVAGMGLTHVLHRYRVKMNDQLAINADVARASLELKAVLQAIGASNRRMKVARHALRVALLASLVAPEVVAALRAEIQVEFVLQEAQIVRWSVAQAKWVAHHGLPPLPPLGLSRSAPDDLGPQPMTGVSGVKDYRIAAHRGSRTARSIVFASGQFAEGITGGMTNEINGSIPTQWSAKWGSSPP